MAGDSEKQLEIARDGTIVAERRFNASVTSTSSPSTTITTREHYVLDYIIGQKLGDAIYGEVRLGWDTRFQRQVAIKLCNKHLLADSIRQGASQENPVDEVRIMQLLGSCAGSSLLSTCHTKSSSASSASSAPPTPFSLPPLSSEHVIQLLDTREQDEWLVIVMEVAPGGDLFEQLARQYEQHGRGFETLHALHMLRQIAVGLALVHANGIAHLDLSLENVLIGEGGVLKICDFGLAQDCARAVTLPKGKAFYVAPEIANTSLQQNPAYASEDGCYDARKADIFSLGVIFFMLLLGFRPFNSASSTDKRYLLLLEAGVDGLLSAYGVPETVVPARIRHLLKCMLAPVEKRANVHEILQQVDEIVESLVENQSLAGI